MRILVVGGGGRESALIWHLHQWGHVLLAAPGNGGTEPLARRAAVDPLDPGALVALARAERIDLVVVGPEAPLARGVADALAAAHLPVLGPTRAAARIETEKSFAKALMAEASVPTASARLIGSPAELIPLLEGPPGPRALVLKADGLAGGKGVVVVEDAVEAPRVAAELLARHGPPLLVEERLEGPELSVIALTDGERLVPLPPARDHKRLEEGNRGPNTGGMGAIAPAGAPAPAGELAADLISPVLAALRARGTRFQGFVYAGLMLTAHGPRVLEYNARLGDPEAQALVPLIAEDLGARMAQAAAGALDPAPLALSPRRAVAVVLCAEGYPDHPRRGDEITGVAAAQSLPGVLVFPAGVRREGSRLFTDGGRVLTVVGVGDDLGSARSAAYGGASRIAFFGMRLRRDIGLA